MSFLYDASKFVESRRPLYGGAHLSDLEQVLLLPTPAPPNRLLFLIAATKQRGPMASGT
jgi:hypothetical protein